MTARPWQRRSWPLAMLLAGVLGLCAAEALAQGRPHGGGMGRFPGGGPPPAWGRGPQEGPPPGWGRAPRGAPPGWGRVAPRGPPPGWGQPAPRAATPFDPRWHNGYWLGQRWYYGPPPAPIERAPGYRPGFAPFRPGTFLPPEYQGYVIDDYARYHLRRPPYGYHWVECGDEFLLVSLATGQIFDVVVGFGP